MIAINILATSRSVLSRSIDSSIDGRPPTFSTQSVSGVRERKGYFRDRHALRARRFSSLPPSLHFTHEWCETFLSNYIPNSDNSLYLIDCNCFRFPRSSIVFCAIYNEDGSLYSCMYMCICDQPEWSTRSTTYLHIWITIPSINASSLCPY